MRRTATYIYRQKEWPQFRWSNDTVAPPLSHVRHQQGRIVGRMEAPCFPLQAEATLQTLTLDVVKSSEIEGESRDKEQVRSSIAKRLGVDAAVFRKQTSGERSTNCGLVDN